ncbi:MAG TPA: pitrilysin family protein [Anaeromyxobacteraceae bacterium]|jgi:predicted Zn-dependent peptidase|nr:pitrilysin family protein [Anaeromyxobacteraceae bacterium]
MRASTRNPFLPLALVAALAAACASTPSRPEAASAQLAPPLSIAPPDRAAVPPKGPPPALKVPAQQHFALSNGLKVRLVEYHRLPIVSLDLTLDAGAVHDPAALPGLASFTASMLTEGTTTRSATQISDDLGFIGASVSAGAGFDQASVSGGGLSRHLDKLLEIFSDVTLRPSFPQADFARVQNARMVSLLQQRDVPGVAAAKAFGKLYWAGHPYGHWIGGTEASTTATKRADLAAYHQRLFVPNAAELVVVGDVTRAELEPKLEKAFGSWKPGQAPAAPSAAIPERPLRTLLVDKPDASQTLVMFGTPGLDRKSPDFVATEVAFQILGGGSASRLFRELREKHGYTYGIYVREEARKLGGTSYIAGNVKADVTGAALKALFEQVQLMRDVPVSQAELDDARSSLALSLPADFATAGGIAGKLAEEVTYGFPDGYWDTYVQAIGKVTAADVQAAVRKYLDPAKLTLVLVGNAAEVKPQLEGFPIGAIKVEPMAVAAQGGGDGPVVGEDEEDRAPGRR